MPEDAGVAQAGPGSLPIRAAVAVVVDREVALAVDATTVVDPAASFRVEVDAPIGDGRLSLRDEQDAMVPSAGTTELGTSWTRFRLAPDAPLRPGSVYRLLLDGAETHAPHDASGRAFRPVVLALRTAGERPAPVGKKKQRRN